MEADRRCRHSVTVYEVFLCVCVLYRVENIWFIWSNRANSQAIISNGNVNWNSINVIQKCKHKWIKHLLSNPSKAIMIHRTNKLSQSVAHANDRMREKDKHNILSEFGKSSIWNDSRCYKWCTCIRFTFFSFCRPIRGLIPLIRLNAA